MPRLSVSLHGVAARTARMAGMAPTRPPRPSPPTQPAAALSSAGRLPRLPPVAADAHKGSRGAVVVFGGSPNMLGAPCFTAHAALRCGAGVVHLVVPRPIRTACLALVPSAMALDADPAGRWLKALPQEAVVAVGMGMTVTPQAQLLLRRLLGRGQRLLIDGGALACLAEAPRKPFATARVILTPHAGEWQRLADGYRIPGDPLSPTTRAAAARALALATGACVVLKGLRTVIDDGWQAGCNQTGGASLAIPGSGDSLSGIIAALWARGLGAFDAARLGAHLHGACGDRWSAAHGQDGLTAMELGDALPDVLRDLQAGAGAAHAAPRPSRRS